MGKNKEVKRINLTQINNMTHQEIKDIIIGLLNAMSVDFEDVKVNGIEERPVFVIKTDESNLLIGEKGKNLLALEYIIKRFAEKKSGVSVPFSIDVNNYQKRRFEIMKKDALKQASRAKLFKHDVELPPMNSYERLLIHSLFTNDKIIKTYSVGEGQYRHVVLSFVG